MRRYRIGVFGRGTSAQDGGADVLLNALGTRLTEIAGGEDIEIVPVPWSAWSHRRRPLRYLWCRIARCFGGELPLVDLRPVCRELRLDLAYFAAPAFARIDVPFVFTLWDIGHRTIPEFPEMRSGRDPWTHREALCRTMLGQASFVVTGNDTGAAEARELFGLSAEKVVAIPFPNPDFAAVAEEVPPWLPAEPFFFYPAQFWVHKNHFTLLGALADLSAKGKRVPNLVCVGADKGNLAYLKTVAASLGIADKVHFPGFVSRGELKALYRRAVALVFPSLLGPNNLPPQEAAVLGCPMLLSDLPGHREQLGDGAVYVSPLDAVAWGEAMNRVASDEAFRSTLVTRAKSAVAGYTMEAYVTRVGALLARMVAGRRLWER